MSLLQLKSGFTISLKQLSNATIFNKLAERQIVAPLPPLYEDDNGVMQENVFHPLYNDALNVFEVQKNAAAFDVLLENSIEFDAAYLSDERWKRFYKTFRFQNTINREMPEREVFLKFFAIDIEEHHLIAEQCLLTEHRVFNFFNSIQATRDGTTLLKASIKNAVNVNINIESISISGIQLVNPVDEFKACQAANMTFDKWLRCEYTLEEKAIVVALNRLQAIIQVHSDDEIQIQSERKNNKKH
jgi:hypothetical protein